MNQGLQLSRTAVMLSLAFAAAGPALAQNRHEGGGQEHVQRAPQAPREQVQRAPSVQAPHNAPSAQPASPRVGPSVDGRYRQPGWQVDTRYNQNQFYPRRGYVVPTLPPSRIAISWGGGNYYYHNGIWFRPWGARYVVVGAPFGIVVPFLPIGYVSLVFGGYPYYYAGNTYYQVAPSGGYIVVAPPDGAPEVQSAPSPAPRPAVPASPDLIAYPARGQTDEQSRQDKVECFKWAAGQSSGQDASVYRRAATACLEGRGYTVK